MKTGYTVYRVDYAKGKKEAIGGILERRGRERGKNGRSLLIEARRLFGRGPRDYINIVIEPPKDRPAGAKMGFAGEIAAITSGAET